MIGIKEIAKISELVTSGSLDEKIAPIVKLLDLFSRYLPAGDLRDQNDLDNLYTQHNAIGAALTESIESIASLPLVPSEHTEEREEILDGVRSWIGDLSVLLALQTGPETAETVIAETEKPAPLPGKSEAIHMVAPGIGGAESSPDRSLDPRGAASSSGPDRVRDPSCTATLEQRAAYRCQRFKSCYGCPYLPETEDA